MQPRHTPTRLSAAAAGMVTLMALGLATTPAAAQQTVYTQPSVFPTPNGYSPLTSVFNDGPTAKGNVYVSFDNFTLNAPASISTVTWQGFIFDSTSPKATTALPDDFEVGFYANTGGAPGTFLGGASVPYSQIGVGSTDFFGTGTQETIYNYRATLPTPFAAAAGTTYWLDVIADMPSPAYWTWMEGSGGDGNSYQTNYYSTSGHSAGRDRSFSLISAPAPEPSQCAVFGLGVFGLSALAVRARRRAV